MRRILILDADMVPALTIARSLHRRSCVLHTGSHIPKPLAAYSRCIDTVHQYPDPLTCEEEFIQWLRDHTLGANYDLIIPVTERTLVPLTRRRDLFEHVRIAMPAPASLETALDKEQTMQLAKELGVPVPASASISSMSELELYIPTAEYPIVLKPARSLGINDGATSQLKVSYAFDVAGLRAGCQHALRFGPVLLQEYFQGQGVGVEIIAQNGKIAYAFQHLRLHEVPLTGGGSSLRMSVPVQPQLLDASQRLMSALSWNGVAMVEFKFNPETGSFGLMEINGRFWGSLPLADVAGADFPSMLLDLELNGEIGPCRPYRNDVYCRKLSSDLYWYEAVLRGDAESRIVKIPGAWEIVRELRLFLLFRHYFDVQNWRDPLPGIVDLRNVFITYCERGLSLCKDHYYFWTQKRAWQRGRVTKALEGARKILFICYGNINRSALADAMIRSYAEDCGLSVESAGFHRRAGRPADPVMVSVALEHGVDLSESLSTTVTPDMIRQSDVILIMEQRHRDELMSIDPVCAEKTWLLAAHPDRHQAGVEIRDPYGESRSSYEFCFQRISDSIDYIKGILLERQND